MALTIRPSPALIVRADASILECVQLMRDQRVGSVLIVSDRNAGDLIGIFSERDLLFHVHLILEGNHWGRPIRTIMTSPVHTIDVQEISQTPSLMLKHHIRHVPVIWTDEAGKKILLGVISMRDVFKWYHSHSTLESHHPDQRAFGQAKPLPAREKLKVALLSKNQAFFRFLSTTLDHFLPSDVVALDPQNEFVENCQFLVIDLDQLEQSFWSKLLLAKSKDAEVRQVIVIYDPVPMDPGVQEVLEALSQSEKFLILRKPINLLDLYEALELAVSGPTDQPGGSNS